MTPSPPGFFIEGSFCGVFRSVDDHRSAENLVWSTLPPLKLVLIGRGSEIPQNLRQELSPYPLLSTTDCYGVRRALERIFSQVFEPKQAVSPPAYYSPRRYHLSLERCSSKVNIFNHTKVWEVAYSSVTSSGAHTGLHTESRLLSTGSAVTNLVGTGENDIRRRCKWKSQVSGYPYQEADQTTQFLHGSNSRC